MNLFHPKLNPLKELHNCIKEVLQNEIVEKYVSKEKDPLEYVAKKVPETKKDPAPIEKVQSSFNLENENFKNKHFSVFL